MLDLNALPHHVYTMHNRHGLELFLRFNGEPDNGKPLAIAAHGFSDVHDSGHMRATVSALLQSGYNVLAYDASHSWGRSGGSIDRATLTRMYHDLEDIVEWARTQPWFRAPFLLSGHSMGGAAALRYAATYPDDLHRLILVAPVVAGKLLAQRLNPLIRALWRLTRRLPDPKQRGKWYRYDLLRDGLGYDGRTLAPRVTVLTTIIAAEHDVLMPPADIRQLYEALPSHLCRMEVVPGADHHFGLHLDVLERLIKEATLYA